MIIPLNIPQIGSFSDTELTQFCVANPELSFERDESGQIFIQMSPTYALTSSNKSELITELTLWNRKYKLGVVFDSNSAFFLPDSSICGPDAAWVSNEKWNALSDEEKKSIPRLVPDFVIELQSETDNLSELKLKMEKWIANGVKLAWLVSTKEGKTWVFEGQNVEIFSLDTLLDGGEVLPEFSVQLSEILSV